MAVAGVPGASSPPAPPPVSLLLFNGLVILAFLSIPFVALRILFLLPPLRPPPRPRRRPGGGATTTTKTNGATAAAAAESLLQASEKQDDDSDDGDDDEEEDEEDRTRQREPTRLLVVLGSGGHTAEMLAMLGKLDARTFLRSWSRRTYVVSEGDGFSAERAREFEEGLLEAVAAADRRTRRRRRNEGRASSGEGKKGDGSEAAAAIVVEGGEEAGRTPGSNAQQPDDEETKDNTDATPVDSGTYTLHTVPRARAIHQPLLTTPLSALRCLHACLSLILPPANQNSPPSRPPDLILTNGPGTGVVVVLAALLLRFLDVGDGRGTSRVRTVYVESWARVTRLSLSGRLLLRVADRFVVQWEGLVGRTGGKGEFLGVLV